MKSKEFIQFLQAFCEQKNLRLFEFFINIFQVQSDEIKILIVDIINEIPLDSKSFFNKQFKNTDDIGQLIDILLTGLDLRETGIMVKTWHTLIQVSKFFSEEEMDNILNQRIQLLYRKTVIVNER